MSDKRWVMRDNRWVRSDERWEVREQRWEISDEWWDIIDVWWEMSDEWWKMSAPLLDIVQEDVREWWALWHPLMCEDQPHGGHNQAWYAIPTHHFGVFPEYSSPTVLKVLNSYTVCHTNTATASLWSFFQIISHQLYKCCVFQMFWLPSLFQIFWAEL